MQASRCESPLMNKTDKSEAIAVFWKYSEAIRFYNHVCQSIGPLHVLEMTPCGAYGVRECKPGETPSQTWESYI